LGILFQYYNNIIIEIFELIYLLRHKLQCTLFGPYVDEFNVFIVADDLTNDVVIFQLAKAKSFQG
jgi:hypothetical protein